MSANRPPSSETTQMDHSTVTTSRRTAVTILVSTGVFMASLDMFIVNIAFPSIQADFPASSAGGLSWVLSAYSIVFAAALVPAGRWFDRAGRKRGFLLGVGVFGLGSALCAAAPTLGILVGARVFQALGAALLMPTSLGLLLPVYPPERRAAAVALWSAVGGVAAAAGPPLGGLLVELSWRWVFVVNVPIALAAIYVGRRLLHEVRDPEPGPRPELLGALQLVAAIGLLTWAIVEAPVHGWLSTRTLGVAAISGFVLWRFAVRSKSAAAPVVPPAVVARPAFAIAAASSLLFSVAFSAMLLLGVLMLTQLWGYSTLAAGLALAPGPATAAAVASRGGPLVARFGARGVAVTGTAVFTVAGLLGGSAIGASPAYFGTLLPIVLLFGLGSGLVFPSLANAAFTGLPPALLSTGIAVFNVSRQVGAALGAALLIAVFGVPDAPLELLDAVHRGYALQTAAAALAFVVACRIPDGRTARAADVAARPLEQTPNGFQPRRATSTVPDAQAIAAARAEIAEKGARAALSGGLR